MASAPCHWVFLEIGTSDDSAGKESACSSGDMGDAGLIPELGRSPGGGKLPPTPVSLPEKSQGQRSLAAYSLWGLKESDRT